MSPTTEAELAGRIGGAPGIALARTPSKPTRLSALIPALFACGPSNPRIDATTSSSDGSGGGSRTGSDADADASADSGLEASSSLPTGDASSDATTTGPTNQCPDNVASDPFCYRKFVIDWEGPELARWQGSSRVRVGNFGPNGEEAFLLAGFDSTPMALAFWEGDGFETRPWGLVPAGSALGTRVPVRFFDGVHSDLIVELPDDLLGVAPWTPDGPGEPVSVGPPPMGKILSNHRHQPVLDVDGDGRQEFLVWSGGGLPLADAHFVARNVDGEPTFSQSPIAHAGSCGNILAGLAVGRLDGDSHVDLAAIGVCGVGKRLAFSAEWGDGAGEFESVGVSFGATAFTSWLGVADFDDDGLDDVVVVLGGSNGRTQSYVGVHRSRGDRTFEPPVEIWNDRQLPQDFDPSGASSDREFILGDVDGDGTDDFIFREFMVAVVQGLTSPQPVEMFEIGWDGYEVEVVSAFDFNHDGRVDFIVDDDLQGVYALISS